MNYLSKLTTIATLCCLTALLFSCSNDDEEEVVIYHQSYIEGKLNGQNIAINDINANILTNKSNYKFSSGNQTDIPAWFDWEVKLVETGDSVITLYLHLDNISLTNTIIYSPNDEDPIGSKSTCYATVADLKNDTTYIYHPTHPAPISVKWDKFMMTYDKADNSLTKNYNYCSCFIGYRWPGMEARLHGTLTCNDETKTPLEIDINYVVF
jgi:hypothetical protein